MRRRTAVTRRAAGLLAGGLATGLLAGVLAGCSGDDKPTSPTSSSSPAGAGLELRTEVTRVAGQLPAARRKAVQKQVGDLVRTYLDAAFVAGRTGVSAFPGFSPGARRLAARDARVLSAGGSVTGAHGSAYVSVFADHGRAEGATVRLVLRLEQGEGRPVPLTGRLLLTPAGSGWRVFGYDVARGDPGHGDRS